MKKKLLSFTILLCVMALTVTSVFSVVNAASFQVDINMKGLSDGIRDAIKQNPELAYSSNPYDYIKDNPYYSNIVKLGTKALPVIEKKIKDSNKNGLQEYILAISAEEIAKVDLKGSNFGWSNAKDWVSVWKNHLSDIPTNVNLIIESKEYTNIKIDKLIKLGTPAIPYVMDAIEKGQAELSPVLEKLLEENSNIVLDKKEVNDINVWISNNKNKEEITLLRSLTIEK